MYWTKYFIPTLKETPQEAESVSHQLMLRAGLIRMLMAGVYSYLPLGLKVLNNIKTIVREEMDATGGLELMLPALQPIELWQKTGRDKTIADVMFRFTDRKGRNVCLGPTHEEVITDLVSNHISSYKQMPLTLYQIQTKFRDEIRPRFGLVRCCEFIMKDAYSFDADEAGLDASYKTMYEAYVKIFNRLGLSCLAVEADSGVMGGNVSHEFMVPAACGEDYVFVCSSCHSPTPYKEGSDAVCPKCKGKLEKVNTIEVGHIFKLGTKYTSMLNANYLNAKGQSQPIVMGCYGIGVSRLISTIIEQNHDQQGIIWPKEVSPFDLIISPLDVTNTSVMEKAAGLYASLQSMGLSVLLDDRDERAGVKFKDAELIGVPVQIILGRDFIAKGTLEYKSRKTGQKTVDAPAKILELVKAGI
jgi:prolyl-tRNA synthetase